jgi:hypothetical protein
MHGVAAKIAQKIPVFFQHQGLYSRAAEEIPQHHARRAAAGDAALSLEDSGHRGHRS